MRQRKVQRLFLDSPLEGHLGSDRVTILNISTHGALLETRSQQAVGSGIMFHPTDDENWALEAQTTRCEVVKFDESGAGTFHVAITYPHADLEARSRLRQFLIDLLMEAVEKWKRNAAVDDDLILASAALFNASETDIEAALRDDRRIGTVWHRLIDGKWTSEAVTSTLQPIDGFCVTSDVEPAELALLRDSYERSDETGRRLIRMLASLTTTERS